MMTITTCVFDAYGTLFDVAGAARLAAAEPGQDVLARIWPKLAEDWRRKSTPISAGSPKTGSTGRWKPRACQTRRCAPA